MDLIDSRLATEAIENQFDQFKVVGRRKLAEPFEIGRFTGQDVFAGDRFQGFSSEGQIHRVARLVLKINREASKDRIDRPNPAETPASVHAEAAGRQSNERFDMVPLELSGRRHLLEFFSHNHQKLASPTGLGLLKVVSGQNPREIAVEVLQRRGNNRFIEDLLEEALSRASLSGPDRGLCQELVYGVVRWQATLDWLISRKASAPPKPLLQNLLRLGLYQIFWLDRIPNHAAVNESVEIAKRKGLNSQAGFVNAVLRGHLREQEATRALLDELRKTDPALAHSHPHWLFERWRKQFGADAAIKLMEWNDQPPKTYARINTLKVDVAKVLPMWREENVDYDFFTRPWCEENLVFLLKSHPPLAQLASFRQGLFYVQDPSTLLAVRQLDPKPGEAILDLCAAPGGKLTYIAQLLKNEGKVLAHDVSSERVALIRENSARLGITCVRTILPEQLSEIPPATMDRVLLDAPCSNTGVMRRRVELRWRITEEEIRRLQSIQLDLLRRAALLLKPGGELLYSTCSLEPEENSVVVEQFLAEQPGFHEITRQQLLPWVEGVDGAFVSRLQRR